MTRQLGWRINVKNKKMNHWCCSNIYWAKKVFLVKGLFVIWNIWILTFWLKIKNSWKSLPNYFLIFVKYNFVLCSLFITVSIQFRLLEFKEQLVMSTEPDENCDTRWEQFLRLVFLHLLKHYPALNFNCSNW